MSLARGECTIENVIPSSLAILTSSSPSSSLDAQLNPGFLFMPLLVLCSSNGAVAGRAAVPIMPRTWALDGVRRIAGCWGHGHISSCPAMSSQQPAVSREAKNPCVPFSTGAKDL